MSVSVQACRIEQTYRDARGDLIHNAHVLMTEDNAGLSSRAALEHVQIADRRKISSKIKEDWNTGAVLIRAFRKCSS